eukprot:TRINITY_DN2907_c0_g1_i2.p2 TRINITY_DN2907_c0_g1~~TRINITY_DN2907_c0_g1_i2.p2  ORF type:complete len:111 (-),score=11.22 TRINITY_DN2907_c0_g1_i2:294-626(-)
MCFTFLRSRSGSLSSLMTKLVALGSTSTLAARFWMVSRTVTRMPFQAEVPCDACPSLPTSSHLFRSSQTRWQGLCEADQQQASKGELQHTSGQEWCKFVTSKNFNMVQQK